MSTLFLKALSVATLALVALLAFAQPVHARVDEKLNERTANFIPQRISQSVISVGATLTSETLKREAEVENTVVDNKPQFRICFNESYSQEVKAPFVNFIYFSVDEKGTFANTSSELPNELGEVKSVSDDVKKLHRCIYKALKYMRAPASSQGSMAFRLKVTYEPRKPLF